MGRMLALVLVAGVIGVIFWSLGGAAQGFTAALRCRRRKPGSYEFDSRYNQVYRRVKGVRGPSEDREAIVSFIKTRRSVEAYFEPKTVAHPLSVVLVAADGEWKRFALAEDTFMRQVSKDLGVPTFDASLVGYPQRMREYRRRPPDDPASPTSP